MLKVGVLGAGHLGKIHLRLLNESTEFDLVGFYDLQEATGREIEQEYGYRYFDDLDALLAAVEVVDVTTPTRSHFEIGSKVLAAGKHLFLEKRIANSVEEAEQLVALAREKGVKGQVGQADRFNPAFTAALSKIDNPMFIEAHRLAEFDPRSTDVPVVLDLMIHDIDTVLSLVRSKVKNISASGISVISETPDMANARVEFENGCVANLTASRISLRKMRKTRFFQRDAYISVDFLENTCEVVKMKDAPEIPGEFDMILENAEGVRKQIYFDNPTVNPNNAILEELEAFAEAINTDTTPVLSFEHGTEVLRVARQIIESINR